MFRKWAAITTVGAALERRVWVITAKKPTFPNLFVLLVGKPGLGKSEAINTVRGLVKETLNEGLFEIACHLAPTDVTKGALLDFLASKKVRRFGPDPEADILEVNGSHAYHAAYLAVSEFGNLVREYDTQLLGIMHDLFDGIPIKEERRYRKDEPIDIQRSLLALLGGTTPAHLARVFPASSWDEGFMARTILIYSGEMIEPDLFGSHEFDPLLAKDLIDDLRQVGNMAGRMYFTDACKEALVTWQKTGQEPKPSHIRLEHYNTRRMRHVLKLSMIAAASRSDRLVVDVEDFQEGLAWLVEAENVMPQIFMEMSGVSDGQLMRELYFHVNSLYEAPLRFGAKEEPVRKGLLINYLANKRPAWQINQIIDMCVDAELLKEVRSVTGDVRYVPLAQGGKGKPKPPPSKMPNSRGA